MSIALTLLAEVRWRGKPVAGDRPQALLAALAALDYPASGLVLFALGLWSLLRRAAPAEDALRLLALADRFAYNRMIPTMRWERITPAAEEAAPGLLARLAAEYQECRSRTW